ncbi:MAG TPA: acyl-CoA dehydrogenase, partial [Mycobacterium sp.]
MELHETEERRALRKAVSEIAKDFGHDYYVAKSLGGEKSSELWHAVGKQGFLGV